MTIGNPEFKHFVDNFHYGHVSRKNHVAEMSIRGLLPKKGIAVIVGDPGAGKTFLMLHLAACLGLGKQFVMLPENQTFKDRFSQPEEIGTTLYLAGEGFDALSKRLEAAYLATDDKIKTNLPAFYQNQLPIFYGPAYNLGSGDLPLGILIPDVIRKTKARSENFTNSDIYPRLVVLDTLTATCYIKDENSNSEIQRLISTLRTCSLKFECLFFLVVHPPKSKRASSRGARGASSLEASADVVWHLKKLPNSTRRILKITKMRDGPYVEHEFEFDLVSAGESAAMIPAQRRSRSNARTPRKTAKSTDMNGVDLYVKEAIDLAYSNHISESSGQTENNVFGVAKKQILEAMIELDKKICSRENREVTKKDTLRKRLERSLTVMLSENIISRTTDKTGSTWYLPKVPSESTIPENKVFSNLKAPQIIKDEEAKVQTQQENPTNKAENYDYFKKARVYEYLKAVQDYLKEEACIPAPCEFYPDYDPLLEDTPPSKPYTRFMLSLDNFSNSCTTPDKIYPHYAYIDFDNVPENKKYLFLSSVRNLLKDLRAEHLLPANFRNKCKYTPPGLLGYISFEDIPAEDRSDWILGAKEYISSLYDQLYGDR